jgi:high affinity Mn2+ porin
MSMPRRTSSPPGTPSIGSWSRPGNVSVLDIFDANTYSHDGRTQFMNWSLATHGAWDYPADSHGYTWGAAAEYFADGWSARAGRFTQPREPNGLSLDPRIFEHYGDAIELARDYSWAGQSGAVRLLAFRNRAVMARYDAALASPQPTWPRRAWPRCAPLAR